nr:MAG: capsid protein [Kuusamo totivirus 2]
MSDNTEKKEEKQASEESTACEPLTEKINLVALNTEVLLLQAEPAAENSDKEKEKPAKKKEVDKKEESSATKQDTPPEETKTADQSATGSDMADPAKTDPPKGEKKDDDAPHYGTHSVYPTDVLTVDTVKCAVPVGQDSILRIGGALKTLARRMSWNNNEHRANFSDIITWSRPYQRSRACSMTDHVAWMLAPVNQAVHTVIQEVEPYIKCKFKAQDYAGVLSNGIPDLNQVMKTARGDQQMSKLVADGVASRVMTNPEVTDISGFFACGYLFAAHMDFCNAAGIVPILAARGAEDIITANISAAAADAANLAIAAIELALNEQALGFRWRNLSATDVQVLIAIALGGVSGATVPAALQATPVTAYIQWPSRKYFIWDTKVFGLPRDRVQLTGKQIRASLAAMAGCLHAYDDMASGFIKCASIQFCFPIIWDIPVAANEEVADAAPRPPAEMDQYLRQAGQGGASWQQIVARTRQTVANLERELLANPDFGGISLEAVQSLLDIVAPPESRQESGAEAEVNKRGALIHALLEVKTIQVQRVRGHNPLWDMMKMHRPRDAIDPLLEADGLVLGGMASDLQMRTCYVIGALLSVCSGVVWHSMNVTGRELNGWASGQGSEISTYMRQLLQATNDGCIAPYYQMVVGVWQQLVSTRLTSTFMRCCSMFSGSQEPYEDIASPDSWWQGTWPLYIPYTLEPISLSWAYTHWCDYWGYIGPKPRVNFSHDLVIGGADDAEYISFHRDEPKYMAAASSDFPFDFIPYGVIMINILRQYFDPEEDWVITFREIRVCRAGSGDLEPPREDMWQPEYFQLMPIMSAGKMISFDHERQSVIVPGLTRETLTVGNFYTLIRMGDMILEGVGLQRDGIVDVVSTPVGALRLLSRLQNLDHGGAGGSSSGRSEN